MTEILFARKTDVDGFAASLAGIQNTLATADILTGTAQGGLGAERVVTNTATITWDVSVAGQAKANVVLSSIVPPGLDTQVLFNDGGAFGTDAGMTYNKTTDTLTLAGDLLAANGRFSGGVRSGFAGTAAAKTVDVGDANFILNFNTGTQPFLGFDSGDYFAFTRATNIFVVGIGNVDTVGVASNLFFPPSTDVVNLGSGTQRFSNLFQKSGGKIDFGNADVTITHGAAALTFASAAGFTFSINNGTGNAGIELGRVNGTASTPFIDFHSGATLTDYDARLIASGGSGAAGGGSLGIDATTFFSSVNGNTNLGSGTQTFGSLFLKSTGVVNFGNSNVTITHAAGALTFAGGTTGYTFNSGPIAGDFGAGVAGSTIAFSITNGASFGLWVVPKTGAGSYNALVGANDTLLAFSEGAIDTGVLTIAPHSNNTVGIRITPTVVQHAGAIQWTSDISPTALSADVNDYNPTGLSTASVIRQAVSVAAVNITGLAGGADGRMLVFHNVSANTIVLKDESVSSTAANRFALTADITMSPDSVVLLQYDVTSSRWRNIGGSGGGGGGASTAEAFVTIGNTAGLSAERALTAGSGITLTDGGANTTATIAVAAGAVLQVLSTTYTANANLTTLIPFDDTIPTNTEGTQILSQAITPASASNKILCIVSNMWAQGQGSGGNGQSFAASLLRGTTTIDAAEAYLAIVDSGAITDNFINDIQMVFLDSPATTSATTYSVRVGADSGTIRLNGLGSGRHFGGAATVTLTLMEIKG